MKITDRAPKQFVMSPSLFQIVPTIQSLPHLRLEQTEEGMIARKEKRYVILHICFLQSPHLKQVRHFPSFRCITHLDMRMLIVGLMRLHRRDDPLPLASRLEEIIEEMEIGNLLAEPQAR